MASGDVKNKIFSIYFDHVDNEDELETANGRLILGDLPPREEYTGEIQWASLVSQGKLKVRRQKKNRLKYIFDFFPLTCMYNASRIIGPLNQKASK